MSSGPAGGLAPAAPGNTLSEKVARFLERTPLRFSPELEKLFLDDYQAKSLPIIRISFILGIALYAIFGVLDVFIAPQTRTLTWLIRYAIVCPLMAISLALTW